jgi:hypothetical protein
VRDRMDTTISYCSSVSTRSCVTVLRLAGLDLRLKNSIELTVVPGRLNVVEGLKPTNQNVGFGRS